MDRKKSHIDLAAAQQRTQSTFDSIQLQHCALPSINFTDIDLSTSFLGFQLAAPIMISSMTGGTRESIAINRNLAEASLECGIAMGVGSQRISLEGVSDEGLQRELRKWIGRAPLFGNVGLANLIKWRQPDCLNRLAESIQADAMIIHLNPMQEIFQDHGDTDWSGSLDCLAACIAKCEVPVIVKEVGMGITPSVAKLCQQAGAAAIDIAGSGGTSFIDIEGSLAQDPRRQQAAQVFSTWGHNTAELLQHPDYQSIELPIIASGGIRHGLDIAKALALGATLTGIAGLILKSARVSTAECINTIEQLKFELRVACWGTGCQRPAELSPVHLDRGN